MRVVKVSEATADRWNDFVAQWPHFELMQSSKWGTFKEALGWKAIRVGVEQDGQLVAGAQMLIKPLLSRLASVAYIPRGPLLNWEDEAVAWTLLSALHASAQKHRAILLRIEPAITYSSAMKQRLGSYGFLPSRITNQPQCSMMIDLTPGTDAILANMRKVTRYNIRYSARRGIEVREANADDLDTFYRLLQFTAERAGFPIRSHEYYRQEWNALAPAGYLKLFLAVYEGRVLAARMPVVFGNKAATFHSCSSNANRRLKPNELLMWESLKWAKSQGCTKYDVWGIPNEIGDHLYMGKPLPKEQKGGLWGVYEFKRGFGGEVVYFVGAYDYVYCPLVYRAMKAVTSRLFSLEKLAELGDLLG